MKKEEPPICTSYGTLLTPYGMSVAQKGKERIAPATSPSRNPGSRPIQC